MLYGKGYAGRSVFLMGRVQKVHTSGYPTAKYKSFPTKEQAEKAFREDYRLYWGKKATTPILLSADYDTNSIAVDAACSGNPGTMHYRGVDL